MLVKICGITNVKDAIAAAEAGADAVGFVFAKSSRRVSPEKAERIAASLSRDVEKIGVFVNEKPSTVRKIARQCGLSAVQLHGDESPADVKALKDLHVLKAFRVDKNFDPAVLKLYGAAKAFLFDTKAPGVYGGTGKAFDWKILKRTAVKKPVILSGGLNAANVARAVKTVHPFAVDVSSGVERAPGKKNLRLVREFIRNAKKV